MTSTEAQLREAKKKLWESRSQIRRLQQEVESLQGLLEESKQWISEVLGELKEIPLDGGSGGE